MLKLKVGQMICRFVYRYGDRKIFGDLELIILECVFIGEV